MTGLFLESIHPELDPALEHRGKNVTPYFGGKSVEGASSPDLPRAGRRYLEEIAAADIRTNCSIPVHANVAADLGILDFAVDLRPGGIEGFRKEFGAGIYPAAIAAFRRLRT